MLGVEFALVRRRQGEHLLGTLQGDLECHLQLRVAGDLAADIPDQAPELGTHFLQPAQTLAVTTTGAKPCSLAAGLDHHVGKGLPQLEPVPLRTGRGHSAAHSNGWLSVR